MSQKEKLPGIFACFTAGVKKGCNMFFNASLPAIVVAFTITQLLTVSGIMPILGKILSPIMAIFGLPGEAAVALLLSTVSFVSGMGTIAALAESGVLVANQVAMLLTYTCLSGSVFLYSGRIIAVTGIDIKDGKYIYAISIITGLLSMFVMRAILMLL